MPRDAAGKLELRKEEGPPTTWGEVRLKETGRNQVMMPPKERSARTAKVGNI
jgi:hypothetical protein